MRSRINAGMTAARALRGFSRDSKGSAAIEFGMIAVPFFMMIFAIIETAMMFFATQALETATQDSARLIMTGQAQIAGMSASQFKANVCTRLSGLLDCANGVDVDVKSYSSFGSVAISNPISGGN